MNIELIKTIIIPIIAGIIAWFSKDKIQAALGHKKEEVNIDKIQIDNVHRALIVWQDMLDDAVKRHKIQISELEGIIDKVKKDFVELQKISDSKDVIIREQRALILKQSKSIAYYREKFEKLPQEYK